MTTPEPEGRRKRFVDSAGVRLHVVEQGPENGRPVLFLHGFPEFWWSWRHQLDAVADAGFRAVALDLRGFGESDMPSVVADYALPASIADVAAVLDGIGGRAVLVSHDWGGALGWACASVLADRLDGLVAMNAPHPAAFVDVLRHQRQLQAWWYMFFFQFEGIAEEALSRDGHALLREWFYDTATVPLAREDVDRYVETFARPGRLTAGLNWYRANVPPQSWLNRGARGLPPVDVPTMLLWGMDDPYLTFELAGRSGAFVTGPYALHALAGTGHWIQQERPDEVGAHLLAFLESL